MKKLSWLILVLFVSFLGILSINTILFKSKQEEFTKVKPLGIDEKAAALRLSKAIRIQTISHQDPSKFDPNPFFEFHRFLEQSFPGLHQVLERKAINDCSLLYKWQGSDPELKPVAFLAHIDVVPVEPGTEGNWTHEAFGGGIADGYVWGRGTMDMKGALMAIIEAVDELVKKNFIPQRTIYLALGHDEEIYGPNGAGKIVKYLKEKGVQFSFTLDEGTAILNEKRSPTNKALAIIGLAEKGRVTLKLTARAKGGHSSMPPEKTTLGSLARAICQLEQNQMPASFSGLSGQLYDYLGPEMPLVQKVLFANRWLFEGFLIGKLTKISTANAAIRTTTAPTMIQGGVKENILPSQAHVLVNFRIKPGETVADVITHTRKVIDDPTIEISIHGKGSCDPSKVSSMDSLAFKAVKRSISEVYPGTQIVPGMVLGGTDSRHYESISDNSYRFTPMIIGSSDLERIHGTNERIGITDYGNMIRFYARLIKNCSESERSN